MHQHGKLASANSWRPSDYQEFFTAGCDRLFAMGVDIVITNNVRSCIAQRAAWQRRRDRSLAGCCATAAARMAALKFGGGGTGRCRTLAVRTTMFDGGAGVSDDFPLAAAWALARTLRLADGPDEVHRDAIAKLELAKRRS